MDEVKYLAGLMKRLFLKKRRSIELTSDWARSFVSSPGVYVIFFKEKLVYVGETGNLRGRMKDLLDSRHHTLRRSIGGIHFSNVKGYRKADSKNKFPRHIEERVALWVTKNCKISVLPVSLGRKELEERIQDKYKNKLYNKREQRIS